MAERPRLEVVTTAQASWRRGRRRRSFPLRAESTDGIWAFEINEDRVGSSYWVTFVPWGRVVGLTSLARARNGGHELLVRMLLLDCPDGLSGSTTDRLEAEVWDLIEQANRGDTDG